MKAGDKKFYQGMALAASLIVRLHDEHVIAGDVVLNCGLNEENCIEAGVDEYDLEVLMPIFAERKRKDTLRSERKMEPVCSDEEAKVAVETVKWIRRLKRVCAEAPKDVWLFASGTGLHVMVERDGKRVTTRNGGFDPKCCVETIKIKCDGGDW